MTGDTAFAATSRSSCAAARLAPVARLLVAEAGLVRQLVALLGGGGGAGCSKQHDARLLTACLCLLVVMSEEAGCRRSVKGSRVPVIPHHGSSWVRTLRLGAKRSVRTTTAECPGRFHNMHLS